MNAVVVCLISIAAVIIGSSPRWAQTFVLTVIHTIAGYGLPLVSSIRAIHQGDHESFHSVHLTYFVFLFSIIEPFSTLSRRFNTNPIAFQLSVDVFILWLLLPKSQGIRHVYTLYVKYIIHSSAWAMVEQFLTTVVFQRVSNFFSVKIYPLVVHYLISYALSLRSTSAQETSIRQDKSL